MATTCEAHIIGEPVNGHNAACVPLVLHVARAVASVEVENVHLGLILLIQGRCKQVAAVRETNFIAALDRDLPVAIDLVAEDVAHDYFVLQRHDQVQSTWMESYSQALFCEALRSFVSLRSVVPDADCFIARASRNQLFAHAYVETCDLSPMERSKYVVKLLLIVVRVFIV